MLTILVCVGLVCLCPPRLWAASDSLSIGYLREGSDFEQAQWVMDELAGYLMKNEQVAADMARLGFKDVELSACDGPRDMVQRLAEGEFHVALATAVVFTRLGPAGGSYGYQPILQTWRAGDIKPPGRNEGVLRRGVIIMGPGCPLFGVDQPSREEIEAVLGQSAFVVPSAESAAGYIIPRMQLARDYQAARPAQWLFAGSDAEVVKHVVSGLVPLGACREGVLGALLPGQEHKDGCRVLFQTQPFPTDAVLLRGDLRPAQTDLGRSLKGALRAFFNERDDEQGEGVRLENAAVRDYEDLARALSLGSELARPSAAGSPATPAGPVLPALNGSQSPAPTPAPQQPPSVLPPLGE